MADVNILRMEHQASHISTKNDRLQPYFELAIKTLTPIADTFDAIAFRGFSGAIMAAPLSLHFKKDLILIRKLSDEGYSTYKQEGPIEPCKVLIVDDMIATGRTIEKIREGIAKLNKKHSIVGVYIYYWGTLTFDEQKISSDGYDICVKCGAETDNGTIHHGVGCVSA